MISPILRMVVAATIGCGFARSASRTRSFKSPAGATTTVRRRAVKKAAAAVTAAARRAAAGRVAAATRTMSPRRKKGGDYENEYKPKKKDWGEGW
jgi:hypothetical protein